MLCSVTGRCTIPMQNESTRLHTGYCKILHTTFARRTPHKTVRLLRGVEYLTDI